VFRGSNQKLRSAPNRCGADLNGSQCLRGFAQNLHAQLLFLGLTWVAGSVRIRYSLHGHGSCYIIERYET
jgi:hypothetical protein